MEKEDLNENMYERRMRNTPEIPRGTSFSIAEII